MTAVVSRRRKRARGGIEALPSGALRVRVYAGIDPALRIRAFGRRWPTATTASPKSWPAPANSSTATSAPPDAGLMLFAYSAEPGTRSEEALHLLSSWAATLAQESVPVDDRA